MIDWYSIYEFDKNKNKRIVCGASTKLSAEKLLKSLFPGREVIWDTAPTNISTVFSKSYNVLYGQLI